MVQDYTQSEELDHPTLMRQIRKIGISEKYRADDHEERASGFIEILLDTLKFGLVISLCKVN